MSAESNSVETPNPSPTPSGSPEPSDSFDAKRQCLEALQRWNLEVGDSVVFDKENASLGTVRPGDQQTTLDTNVFGLKTKNMPVHQFHVEFVKVFTSGRFVGGEHPLIDPRKKITDYLAQDYRHMHRKLLDAFIAKYPNVFGKDPHCFCYDYATTLFSLVDLPSFNTAMHLEEGEIRQVIDRPFEVKLRIKKPADNVFNIRDVVTKESLELSDKPREIIRFLELATSRYASQHPEDHVMYEAKKTYFMNPQKFGFTSPDLNNGKYLAAGASKVVVCVEGPKNKGAPAVIVDSKKTPFYHAMNLLELLCRGLNVPASVGNFNYSQREMAAKFVKRLDVFPIYGNRQQIPITLASAYDRENAFEEKIEYEGQKISVFEYFKRRYQITLQYPQWPLVKGAKKIRNQHPLYPIELLAVADYQRVGNGNISSSDIATIVRACAVNPSVKINEIVSCYNSLQFKDDQFMKNADIEVLDQPLQVNARVLKAPQVHYANGSLNPESNGKWRLPREAKYVRCSSLRTWCALFLRVPRERMNMNEFNAFVEKYYFECRNRGLVAVQPLRIWDIDCHTAPIEEAFRSAYEAGCEFILIGHSDLDTTMHSVIKGMERKYSVISQCVKTKTMQNVLKKSPLSLENIVAKTNVKLGGHNYDVTLHDFPIGKDVLFIGLGMNHPAGGLGTGEAREARKKEPSANDVPVSGDTTQASKKEDFPKNVSVLGFAANDGINPNEFIGNFFFSPMHRDEKLSVLDKLLEEIFERFIANRKCAPSRVILYRSGCDEGGYRSVLRYEIPIITSFVEKYAPGAPVTVIIPSKMHSFRFFKQNINPAGRSDDQNIRPGTVVDQAVVNNQFSEFYLNSHLAIQGTAKTAKYTIIYSSEKKVDLDMLERWTNALAYDFQIVTSPTSVPAPVYIALRYAERGRQIWNTFPDSDKANLQDGNGNGGNGNGSNGNGSNGNGSNGNSSYGNGSNGNSSYGNGAIPLPKNDYFAKSLSYNFTHREYLRCYRVNA